VPFRKVVRGAAQLVQAYNIQQIEVQLEMRGVQFSDRHEENSVLIVNDFPDWKLPCERVR
jgi:hypothetical protein